MSREAIESFVDEIRDDLPRMRRLFAIMHAWPDDRDALQEAQRLTHSITETAALLGAHTLSEIAKRQESLLERLMARRCAMDDRLRDSLERLADVIESYAAGLLAGIVPEQRLLADALALGAGLPTPPDHATEGLLPVDFTSDSTSGAETCGPADGGVGRPAPSARGSAPSAKVEVADSFCRDALGHLREMAEQLDTYRRDLTRSDLLADVCRLSQSLKQDTQVVSCQDFVRLIDHAAELLQQVVDHRVPPTESIADCLQACVDALEQRLDQELDEAILQQLHDRIDELCQAETTVVSGTVAISEAAPSTINEPQDSAPRLDTAALVATHEPTSPDSIELDDRSQLAEEMLVVFNEEAEDHLRLIYSAFAELKINAGQMGAIQEVRRSAHTLKGAAGSVGLRLVSKLSHRMEDLLDVLFGTRQPVTSSTLALLYDTTDAMQDLVHGNFAAATMPAPTLSPVIAERNCFKRAGSA